MEDLKINLTKINSFKNQLQENGPRTYQTSPTKTTNIIDKIKLNRYTLCNFVKHNAAQE